LPHVIVLGAFTALIFMEPDFGSAVILASVTWIMLFVGGGEGGEYGAPRIGQK